MDRFWAKKQARGPWAALASVAIALAACGGAAASAQTALSPPAASQPASAPRRPPPWEALPTPDVARPPDAESTSRAVAADDPQRSPRATLTTFLLALNEAKTKPARIVDAVGCLDLTSVPAEARTTQGPLLAQQLGEIIDQVFRREGLRTEDVPDTSVGPPFALPGLDPPGISLAQDTDGRWRVTADSVSAIPAIRQSLFKAATTQPIETPAPSDAPPAYRSARATMVTYRSAIAAGDSAAAARCLDLSGLPAATREQTGRRLANRLQEVMDRINKVVIEQDIPDRADGPPYTFFIHERGRIEIARREDGDRKGQWLFTATTVASIEALFEAMEAQAPIDTPRRSFWSDPSLWVRERIPPSLKHRYLGAETWQWIGIPLVVLVGFLTNRAALAFLRRVTRWWLSRDRIRLSRESMAKFVRPFGVLVLGLTWWGGLNLLDLGARTIAILWPPLKLIIIVAGVWAAYRLMDLLSLYAGVMAEKTLTKVDDVLVPLLRKTLKIILLAVGVAVLLQALGIQEQSITTLFAGLGIGGLAFALAAQDTLKNFLGSVTVVIDRPFQVGDWIRVGDVEGAVQSVGLRSTRIRTFQDSEVTVPNANLINANVDNLGRRQYRRLRCLIRLSYDTRAESIEALCEGVRELIRRHPYTRKEDYHVYVTDFGPASIEISLLCFFRVSDWGTELREKHRLLVDVMRLAERLGVALALPEQTVHLARETPPQPRVPRIAPDARPATDSAFRPQEPLNLGRQEAAAIAAQFLPASGELPPPVTFDAGDRPPPSPSDTRFL